LHFRIIRYFQLNLQCAGAVMVVLVSRPVRVCVCVSMCSHVLWRASLGLH